MKNKYIKWQLFLFIGFSVLFTEKPFAQPTNNNCSGAIAVTVGAAPVTGNVTGATNSGVPDNCFADPDDDVWYKFTTAAAGNYTITVVSSSSFDAVSELRSGACNGTYIICTDASGTGGTETITYSCAASATYSVRVYDYYTGMPPSTTFTIRVTGPPADPCTGVISIAGCGSGFAQSFSGGGSGAWNTSFCGYGTPGSEQVYSFVAPTTGNYTIQITAASGYVDYGLRASNCASTGWTCIKDINTPGAYPATPMSWTAGTTYYILLDDEDGTTGTHTFYINCPAGGTPAITLTDNVPQVSAANVAKGTTNHILHKFSLAVTTANATLTGAQCITAGTYLSADIINLKVRYSTDAALDGADATLSAFTTPGTAGTKTFPSFSSQVINNGTTGYIFITADIAAGATAGNTINVNAVTTAQLTFSSGTKSGSTTAGGIQTIIAPDPCSSVTSIGGCGAGFAQSYSGGASGAWNTSFCGFGTPGTEKVYSFVAPTTGSYTIQVTAASGYVDYSWRTSGCASTGWTCIKDINTPGAYPATPMSWSAGTTYYILLDDEDGTTGTHTFYLNCPVATPNIVLSDNTPQVTAANVLQGTTEYVLHKFKLSVTITNATLTGSQCVTAGTYLSADIINLKVRYSTDAALDGADATLSTYTTPGGAGTKTFPSFTSQVINSGTTGYIFITADIAAGATAGNTINVNAVTTAQLTFSSGTKSGSTTAGGVQTIAAPDPCSSVTSIGGCGAGFAQSYSGGASGAWNTSFCGFGTPGTEKVYSFVAPTTGSYTIQVTAASGYVDYGWRASSCASTGWTCIKDINTTGAYPATPMSWTAGTTYYILLDDEDGTTGTHTFYLNCPVANDECVGAISLTVNSSCITTSGTTSGATQTVLGSCTGTPDDDVWYKFVAPASGKAIISVDGSITFDAVVNLLSGVCNGSSISCADATSDNGIEIINASGLTSGATYYIRVYHYGSGSGSSSFDICVYDPPAPSNDNCMGSVVLTVNSTCVNTAGTSAGATQTLTGCSGNADDDVWYKFTAPANGAVTISVTPSAGFDPVIDLRSGTCSGSSSIACQNGPGLSATGLSSGTTYYIRVYHYGTGSGTGNFDICVWSCSGAGSATWNGTTNADWHTASNWSTGTVPTNCINVTIPSGTTFSPNISGSNAFCNNLAINAGATLTVSATAFYLTVSGNFTNNGTLNHSGTTYIFVNGSSNTIGGTGIYTNLKMNFYDGCNYTLANDISIYNFKINFTNSVNYGTVNLSSYSLTVTNSIIQDGFLNANSGTFIDKALFEQSFEMSRWNHNTGTFWWDISGTFSDGSFNIDDNDFYSVRVTTDNTNTISISSIFSLDLSGNLTIDPNTDFNSDNIPINIKGNWINNGTYAPTSTTVTFTGTSLQTIGGSSVTTFNNLTINNSTASSAVTLNKSVIVIGTLTLANGDIVSGITNRLTLYESATVSPATAGKSGQVTSFVSGYLDRIINSSSDYEFPMGNTTTGIWRPVTLTRKDATSRTWTVRIIESNPEAIYGTIINPSDIISDMNNQYYYDISRSPATGNAGLKLWYEDADYGPWPENMLLIGHWCATCNSGSGWWDNWGKNIASDWAWDVTANWVQALNVGIFSPMGLSRYNGSPLPIELIDFSGKCSDNEALLKWSTASEINNNYFSIERSTNGMEFVTAGIIDGAGNSSSILTYKFIDDSPYSGINYYKLKQTDFDGTYQYSEIIAVKCNGPENDVVNLFMVIDQKSMIITIHQQSDGMEYQTKIFDVSGKLVLGTKHSVIKGVNTFRIDINKLAAGIYQVTVQSEDAKAAMKVLIH